jgi:hypothetical protein
MNPFSAPASFPFANLAQAQPWSYFRLPVSIETVLDTHRKNAAAWTSASDVAFDALSVLAQRQRGRQNQESGNGEHHAKGLLDGLPFAHV